MADALAGAFLFFGLVFGLRRGFYKELIAFGALVLGAILAKVLKGPAGAALAARTGAGVTVGEILAAAIIFSVVALIVNIVGRILLNKLKNPDGESAIEEGAEEIADIVADKGKKGPMTLLTDPIARATSGAVYWTDKILGGALGVVKAAIGVALVFVIVVYWSRFTGSKNELVTSIGNSAAMRLFRSVIEPHLLETEEYRFLKNIDRVERLAGEAKEPAKAQAIVAHPALAPLKNHVAVASLATDPKLVAAWEKRDMKALLLDPKVRGLLQDPSFRQAFADANLDAVLKDVMGGVAPPPPPTLAPKEDDPDGPPPPAPPAAPPAAPAPPK